jgi:hypothetical protein
MPGQNGELALAARGDEHIDALFDADDALAGHHFDG